MNFNPTMIIPQILYDNVMRHAAITSSAYSGTNDPLGPIANAYDWQDWSLFNASAGTTYVDVISGAVETIDTFAFYVKAPMVGNANQWAINLQVEISSGVFVDVTTPVSPMSQVCSLQTLNSVVVASGMRMRIKIVVPSGQILQVRQFTFGQRVEPTTGQNQGVTPPSFQGGYKLSNAMAVNGSLIGRSIVRQVRQYQLQLDYLDPVWVRSYWMPFMASAIKYPFYLRWNPLNYSTDVMWCSASEIPSPSIQKHKLLTVKMPIVGIST